MSRHDLFLSVGLAGRSTYGDYITRGQSTLVGRLVLAPRDLKEALAVLGERLGKHKVYVFTFQGKPVDRCSTRAWKQAVARAGISSDFRWHDLRHTWALWHVQRGTRLQELMELGGWASYEMVLRYAHLATEQLRAAASRIDDTNLTQRPNLRLVHSR